LMEITILAIGTVRERAVAKAISEYEKRLSAYTSISIRDLLEVPYRESFSEAQKEQVKRREGAGILSALHRGSHLIALDVAGTQLSSEELAGYLHELMVSGTSSFTFAIGGSLGLAPEVLGQAQLRLSLSRMTFPHQLARLILVEQLYRAFKIMRKETYHK
jgi:23S rRNA (pseudouridine1915-N3)-methyltransferase